MTKKLLKQLVNASFQNGNILENMVVSISKRMKRSELKQYINGLKKRLQELTVYIESPFSLTSEQSLELKKIFPDKTIITIRKPSLMLGIRILNRDMIYDFSLKNKLESLITHIKYDR